MQDGADEATAHAINAEPWEPLPGMVKLRYSECGYWFVAGDAAAQQCPDCVIRLERRRRRELEQAIPE